MIIVNIDSTCVRCGGIWQYDYGQILRIQNLKLPPAVEIHFSLEERGGRSVTRVGTTKDGVTDVVIPDSMLENRDITTDYKIYAFIYLTDSESGQTEYKISMSVKSRPRPESFERQEDAELFRTAIAEANKSATSAQESATKSATAKDESIAAAKEAKQSAQEASTFAQEAQTSANESNELADIASSAAKASINAKEIAVSAANSADSNALAASRSAQEAQTSAKQADTASKSAAQSKQDIHELKTAIDSTAEQIATDRTTVETDKKEVQKAKSDVEELKSAVEQKSSEALVDLENAEITAKKNINDLKDVVIKKGNAAISGIETARDNAINDVNNAKDTAVNTIAQEEESAVNAVDDAKDNAVAEINKNENVQQIKQNKDDIKEAKTDIEELKDKKITKFYSNSIGESYLQDSDDGKIQDMILYGKSEQKQYTGKNLLKYPYDNTTKTANGIIFTDNGDGSVTIKGTATTNSYFSFHDNVDGRRLNLPTGTYKLIIKGIDKVKGLLISNSSSAENDRIFTVTDGNNEVWCFIEVPKDIAINETIYPMIQSTTYQNEDYEPYTGGIPSPNPNYPQEIKNIVNPIMKICGKNLLNLMKGKDIVSNNGVTYERNSDGSYKRTGTATSVAGNIWLYGDYGQKPKDDMSNVILTLKKNRTYYINDCVLYTLIDGKYMNFTGKTTPNKDVPITGVRNDAFVVGKTYDDVVFPMVVEGGTEPEWEPYKEQIVNLPYTLNAIPVKNGGNITIDDQQYIADYVDVERGVKVQMIKKWTCSTLYNNNNVTHWYLSSTITDSALNNSGVKAKDGILCNGLPVVSQSQETDFDYPIVAPYGHSDKVEFRFMVLKSLYNTWEDFADAIKGCEFYYPLAAPIETKLTQEEIKAFKELATYYLVTNVSVTSDQLDGYTTFNYPVSLANGWDYVKQQLGDTRDYIYDVDNKTQDIDTQSAEAYVNSEYAVALTELEVM